MNFTTTRLPLTLAFVLVYLLAPFTAYAADTNLTTDNVKVGRKAAGTKQLIFDQNAGAANPRIRSTVANGLEFSTDGVNFNAFGSGSGGASGVNLLAVQNLNPDAEQGTNLFTNPVGGTLAVANSSTNPTYLLAGKGSLVFTASGAAQNVRTSLATVTYGLANRACFASVQYLGDASNLTLRVLDASSNVVVSRAMNAQSSALPYGVPFACGAQGSQYRIEIISSAANPIVALDSFYLGEYPAFSFIDAVPLGVQQFTASGTYTPSAGTRYARVKIVSGGGGGAASGTSGYGTATAGGGSSFGSLISCTGGGAGTQSTAGPPGACTVTAPAYGTAYPGNWGGTSSYNASSGNLNMGGIGGASPFGGAGYPGPYASPGGAATASTGSGGGGAGSGSTAGSYSGNGGSSGGYADVIVSNPASSYVITIGSAGAAGSAGANGSAGGAGAAGRIVVEEYGFASGQAIAPQLANAYAAKSWIATLTTTVGASAAASATRTTIANASYATYTLFGSGVNDSSTNAQVTTALQANDYEIEAAGLFRAQSNASPTTETSCVFEVFDGTSAVVSTAITAAGAAAISKQEVSTFKAPVKITSGVAKTYTLRVAKTAGDNNANSLCAVYSDAAYPLSITLRPLGQNAAMPVLSGPLSQQRTLTSAATLSGSDHYVFADPTSAGFTLTLPSPSGIAGKSLELKQVGASANNVAVTGSISGSTRTINLYESGTQLRLVSDGSTWQVTSPKRRMRAHVPACSISSCSTDTGPAGWVTITRSAAGAYALSYPNAFTAGDYVNCDITIDGAANAYALISGNGNTGFNLVTRTPSTLANVDAGYWLGCDGNL